MKASSLIQWSAFALIASMCASYGVSANNQIYSGQALDASNQCLLIKNNLWVDDRVLVNATSISLGGNLFVKADAKINADVDVGLSGTMVDRSLIDGNVTAGTTVTRINEADIRGDLLEHTSTDDVVLDTLPLLPAVGNDITVNLDKTETLVPGKYRAINIHSRGTLILTSGEYYFQDLHLDTDSHLLIQGHVRVIVNGQVTIEQQSQVTSSADSDSFYLYTHHNQTVTIGTDVKFQGQLHAPQSKVNVGARSDYTGCINARGLQFHHDSVFNQGTYIPVFDTPPLVPVGQCLSINNNLRLDDRAKLTSDKIAVGGKLRMFANAQLNSDVTVELDAIMRDRSVINGDATVGTTMRFINGAYVDGTLLQHTGSDSVVINRLPLVSAQGNNVWVGLDKSKTLNAGSYGAVNVASRGTLTLTDGEYHFSSLKLATNAKVVYSGDVTVVVNNKVTILDRSTIQGTDQDDTFSIYSHQSGTFVLATDVKFSGQIHAPNAQVRVGARSQVEGCVNAKGLRLNHDSRLSQGEYLPAL